MNASDLTKETLRQLIEAQEPPCVSIYVPLGENTTQRDEARIRLKNQIGRAERALRENGMDQGDIDALLKPVRAIPETNLVGGARSKSLALLRSRGNFESLELPELTPPIALVGDNFYVKPLLPMINVNRRFRLLAISQNDVRLFEGDRYGMRSLQPASLPRNIQEALRDDDNKDQTLQFHTGAAPAGGDRPAVFHGHVVGDEHFKERVQRFCQLVDNAVTDYFDNQDVPLILAAADPVPGLYGQANHYRNLHSEAVAGDPRQLSEEVLHERAWSLVAPQATQERSKALSLLAEGLSKGRATTDLASALNAAREGRVATLLVNADRADPGNGGTSAGRRGSAPSPDKDFENGVNHAVVETLKHGGWAFAVPHDDMPAGALVGALYRY